MPMNGDLLRSDEIDLLLRPANWMPVFDGRGAEPSPNQQHAQWLRENPHTHAHPEILIIVSGGGCHAHGEQIFACHPGRVFFFAPFDAHDPEPAPHLPDARQLWFALHGSRATARMIEIADGSWRREWALVLPAGQDAVGQWRRAADGPTGVRRLRLMAVAQLLVAALLETNYDDAGTGDQRGFQQAVVAAICDHIEETAGRGDDLASLSQLAGYSKYHFARLFKRETGMTILEYIDTCRLARTREMIASGHTYAEIAEALGFSSPQSFSRWYQERK